MVWWWWRWGPNSVLLFFGRQKYIWWFSWLTIAKIKEQNFNFCTIKRNSSHVVFSKCSNHVNESEFSGQLIYWSSRWSFRLKSQVRRLALQDVGNTLILIIKSEEEEISQNDLCFKALLTVMPLWWEDWQFSCTLGNIGTRFGQEKKNMDPIKIQKNFNSD